MKRTKLPMPKKCDVILQQCRKRFSFTNHLEAKKLLCLSYVSTFNINFPEDSLAKCTAVYPMLDGVKLRTELCVLYSRQDMHRRSGLVQLLALLNSGSLCSTFSEVVKLIKILITTLMTTAEAECKFSTVKRIKIFLRSTMTTERLSALAMISIKNKMIPGITDFNKSAIDRFARAKSRRMEFIFK